MKITKSIITLLVALPLIAACATSKGYRKLYPGMSSQEVASTMRKNPKRVVTFEEGYSAWYYGENRCVLIKDDKLVAKNQSETTNSIYVPGIGSASTTQPAECLPPNVQGTKKARHHIYLPGIGSGTIK